MVKGGVKFERRMRDKKEMDTEEEEKGAKK